jgi:hypothetical protein
MVTTARKQAAKKTPAKKTPAGKAAAKKTVARKAPAKKAAAKKTRAAPARTTMLGEELRVAPGDVVLLDGTGAIGRVCSLIGFGQACVIFGDGLGCRRVFISALSEAPAGANAPACMDCDDC